MSGGHFDYVQHRLEETELEIKHLIESNEDKTEDEFGYPIGRQFSPEIMDKFGTALSTVVQARKLIHAIDWLVSGDDGPETFLDRLSVAEGHPAKTKKLSTKQREFLVSIYDSEDKEGDAYWECFKHESRTAMSLLNRGLIELQDKGSISPEDNYFMVRLTRAGLNLVIREN